MESHTKNLCACTQSLSTFWPPNHVYSGPDIIENYDQFCTSFFHVLPCWEINVKKHICLRENPRECRHKNVTIIVRVLSADKNTTLKIKRYTNCISKTRRPVHAEEFIITDNDLLIPNSHIIIYTQLQPCHHSGGSDADKLDPRSCTELLLKWANKELYSRNINLTIQCSNIYKAMWYFPPEQTIGKPLNTIFSKSSDQAREGIKLLSNSGIYVTVIDDEGWEFLKGLVSTRVNITNTKLKLRKEVDNKLKNILLTLY